MDTPTSPLPVPTSPSTATVDRERRLWTNTIVFSAVIFAAWIGYLALETGSYGFGAFNRSLALTAVTVIGVSFALSGLCYFWDFADAKIIYRKHLGLVGFGYGLAHAYTSAIFYYLRPVDGASYIFTVEWPVFGVQVSNVIAFSLGLLALLIFAFMALISNRAATVWLGGVRWRQALRFGYLAYILLIFHYGIKNEHLWALWLREDGQSLPPSSLVIVVFSSGILALRLALSIAVHWKQWRKRGTPTSPL